MKLMFRYSIAALLLVVISTSSIQAAENEGKWSIGIHPGVYKLVLSDHSDPWTPGWLVNADVKYGLTNRWSLGVEGSWMKTYAADFSGKSASDGAGASFSKVDDGAQQRAYLAGLIGQYNFTEDSKWTPHFDVGAGMYIWKWTDKDGNTLLSNSPVLDVPNTRVYAPPLDKAGQPYELKDQELYVMAGLGLDYKASDLISIGLGARFRYLTHVFTSFTDNKDVVGTGDADL
ncbi:MAG TPA: outer membrane beta-barrel protein, partial [Candidatus Krumholzibacteria bacterium]|nr:outer membrane beta-barrel protein [Candidatus Krumholzibacteria bacterium]